MEARVVTYPIKQGQVAERVRHGRDVAGLALAKVQGLKGRIILVDPAAHKNMTVALFENQADMDAAARDPNNNAVFGRKEHASGEVTREAFRVEHWDGEMGRIARVVSYQIKRGQIEDRMRHWRERSAPGLRDVPGQKGRLVLINRDSHKNLTISFWNSQAELRAFEQNETHQASLAQGTYAEGAVLVEHFEVGHHQ
jgi:heme-degrading monooxygenase HmoA